MLKIQLLRCVLRHTPRRIQTDCHASSQLVQLPAPLPERLKTDPCPALKLSVPLKSAMSVEKGQSPQPHAILFAGRAEKRFAPGNIFACNPATARLTSTKLGCDPKGEKIVYVNGRTVVVSFCKGLKVSGETDTIALLLHSLDSGSRSKSFNVPRR